jgi:WD40 repeat protein
MIIAAASQGSGGEIQDVAFGPDGTRLATASQDGTAKVWDAATGVSPDGTRLAAAGTSEGTLAQVWDVVTGQEILTLKGHTVYADWKRTGKRRVRDHGHRKYE